MNTRPSNTVRTADNRRRGDGQQSRHGPRQVSITPCEDYHLASGRLVARCQNTHRRRAADEDVGSAGCGREPPGRRWTDRCATVLAAAPDGYTLLAASGSTFLILPAQKDNLPVDVNRDLVPIGLTGKAGLLLAVSPKLGVNSLAELIALAKKEPHTIVIGTNPAGSLPHLAARLLVELSKAPFTVLPYATGGTNEAIRDILGGRVHAVIESRPGLKGVLDSGDLKALAIMSSERHEKFPDLPAAAETVPGLTAVGWSGARRPQGDAGGDH